MRIVILTSSRRGTASYCLKELLSKTNATVVLVILSEGQIKNKWKHYKRKLRKTMRIGILGAINGIRMRKWYNHNGDDVTPIDDLESICKKELIPFQTVPVINSPDVAALIRSSAPDLGLSLGNSYIGASIFSLPRFGMLNIHGEVLPQFQNAQSVIWQLYEGKSETGFTIHKINNQMDAGEILLQEKFPILFRQTLAKTVYATNLEILRRAAGGLIKVLNDFSNYYENAKPQGEGKSYTTPGFFQFLKIQRNFRKLKEQQENSTK